MNHDQNINIDPESRALQYRIDERDGVWYLRREYPDMPRTPDEHYAMAHIRAVMPSNADGQLTITDAVQERLDAEVGDVVSVVTVASAQVQVIVGATANALQPLIESINRIAEEFVGELQSAMVDALTADGEDDDDGRLPEKFQKARRRRDDQRENARHQAGSHFPEDETHE